MRKAAQLLVLSVLIISFNSEANAQTVHKAELVNTIDTSAINPESPDPMGIAYSRSLNKLLMVDSEVGETPQCHWNSVNYWQMSLSGGVEKTTNTLFFSNEPTEITYDSKRDKYYFSDDDARKIFTVDIGSDELFGTVDDTVSSFSTNKSSPVINDPEGVAYDPVNDYLLIVDGSTGGTSSVYIFAPGADGIWNGTQGTGDDILIKKIATTPEGISDPEGVDVNYDSGNLYVTGQNKWVLEYDHSGTLVSKFDTTGLNIHSQSGIAYGPSSLGASKKSLYITDRGVDNNSVSCENDGKIFEMNVSVPVPSPTTTSLKPGDANGDGKVDGFDYVSWWQNFNQSVTGGASEGDFDNSGSVDGFDYVIWWQNFGT